MTIDSAQWVEWVGYIASFFVMSSFLFKDIKTLRIINSIGCACFVAYGFMLDISWPIVLTNVFILCINSWFILRPLLATD